MGGVELKDISYSYPDGTVALSNVSWSIEEGQKVAILGPNGAGKSTLLKILAGLVFPDSGTVMVDGEELSKKNADVLRTKMGVLFQDPDDQIFMPRVWDDVAFGPINLGLPPERVRELVESSLKVVHMQGHADRVPHHMSYGEKKRVAIAGILAMEPDILLLDEPTSNLDPKGRRELIEILGGLDKTMIVATHDVNAATLLADRALVLNERKLAEGTLRDVFSQAALLEKANLDVPDITKLFMSLRENGVIVDKLPLSIEEALKELSDILGNKKKRRQGPV